MAAPAESCPVCGEAAREHDAVDFNKSCEEARGRFLPAAGIAIRYCLCAGCGFCFAPEFRGWSREEFARRIYNADYALVDPDYASARPAANAELMARTFAASSPPEHLDFGGGAGVLSARLRALGWNSSSWDPFASEGAAPRGPFALITAFEVFEHAPDPQGLVRGLDELLAAEGLILFSTLASDGHIRAGEKLAWWYAAPRNGHVSLHTRRSLSILAANAGFRYGSFSPLLHVLFRTVPAWARHVFASG